MATIIEHFDVLTKRGLKIIPLRENTKVPMCKGWTQNWNKDQCREKLEQFPCANLGILLGDIIDVEGDSEEANKTILDLIGDYPHPMYQSIKSIHHLFLTPDRCLRHFRYGDIEFRGYGHQSVIPPSQHQGHTYKWMRTFQFPIPEMPPALRRFYERHHGTIKKTLKPHHVRAWCGSCKSHHMLHEKRFDLETEAFLLLESKWECRHCRALDLRDACRLIRLGL